MKNEETNKPVYELKLGMIKAAVWAQATQYGPRHSVTVSRLYRDQDQWKRSHSFGRDDLLPLAKILDQAHSWIVQHEQAQADASSGTEQSPDPGTAEKDAPRPAHAQTQ